MTFRIEKPHLKVTPPSLSIRLTAGHRPGTFRTGEAPATAPGRGFYIPYCLSVERDLLATQVGHFDRPVDRPITTVPAVEKLATMGNLLAVRPAPCRFLAQSGSTTGVSRLPF